MILSSFFSSHSLKGNQNIKQSFLLKRKKTDDLIIFIWSYGAAFLSGGWLHLPTLSSSADIRPNLIYSYVTIPSCTPYSVDCQRNSFLGRLLIFYGLHSDCFPAWSQTRTNHWAVWVLSEAGFALFLYDVKSVCLSFTVNLFYRHIIGFAAHKC